MRGEPGGAPAHRPRGRAGRREGRPRGRSIDAALDRGGFREPPAWMLATLTWGGAALGVLTALLILFD